MKKNQTFKKRFIVKPIIAVPVLAVFFSLSFPACKSTPVPAPSLTLIFKGPEAEDPSFLKLHFTLDAKAVSSEDSVTIKSWKVLAEGREAGAAFSLDYPKGKFIPVNSVPITLDMDVAALAAMGLAPRDNYDITLILELNFERGGRKPLPPQAIEVICRAAFPGVRPPDFSITGIAVIKAELVNTRFRVALKIDNPNPFPLELSSFAYELFGNGRLWADGIEKNILKVEGKSTLSGDLYLIMNFINMERMLLDQIIKLEDVNYSFSGDVQVSTGVDYLPVFHHSFKLSGFSRVLE